MTPIYFCTVVHNRWQNFTRLVRSIVEMHDLATGLSVFDWASTDHPPINSSKDFLDVVGCWPENNRVFYAVNENQSSENINRSAARNTAFSLVDAAPSDIVFFVDCDMVVPANMAQHIRSVVKHGVAYFPIPYSLYRDRPAVVNGSGPPHNPGASSANGWWRKTSNGNCAFTVSDFLSIGKWDERFGDRYGREDDDMSWRAHQSLSVVRDEIAGFFHHWHPAKTEKENPRLRDIPWHPLYEGAKND